jgi:hypothetical protein
MKNKGKDPHAILGFIPHPSSFIPLNKAVRALFPRSKILGSGVRTVFSYDSERQTPLKSVRLSFSTLKG